MRKINPKDLSVDDDLLEESPIHGELDIEALVFRQIERTANSASQDETLFANNVRVLMTYLPEYKQEEIQDRSGEYTSTIQRWQFKYWCGVPLGTIEEPINGSPALIEEEITDWHQLFQILMNTFEQCGVTWKRDDLTVEARRVDESRSSPVPTPVFAEAPTQSMTTEALIVPKVDVPKIKRRCCQICGEHIAPKTGTFYKHRLVHIKDCFDIAKTKWIDQ